MAIFGKKSKIHPSNKAQGGQQFVRITGWTWPLHYLQFVTWAVLIVFALVYFGICAVALPGNWQPAGLVCAGVMYAFHIILLMVSTSINPADKNSKTRIDEKHQYPKFDRSKHAHVIENEYCNLCEVHVDPGSKHCRVCNKCVGGFDHHCLWLNNCVGSRNYRHFIATIFTAEIGLMIMLAVAIYVFVQALQEFEGLDEGVWWYNLSTSWILFEVFIGIFILLGFTALILLLQLTFFHIRLFFLKITTYEYIVQQRDKEESESNNQQIQSVAGSQHQLQDFANSEFSGCTTEHDDPGVIGATVLNQFTLDQSKSINHLENTYPDTKVTPTPSNGYQNNAYSSPRLSANLNNNSREDSRSVTPQSRAPSSLGELEDGLPNMLTINGAENTENVKPSQQMTVHDGVSMGKDSEPVLMEKIEDTPEVEIKKPKRKKRSKGSKVSKKSLMKHREDGAPRALPILHESPRADHDTNLIQEGPYTAHRLPPLRSSVDWASSSEDLSSAVATKRKLPPLSASSSMNSLASYTINEIPPK